MKNAMKFTVLLALFFVTTAINATIPQEKFQKQLLNSEYTNSKDPKTVIIRNKKGTAVYETEVTATDSKHALVRSVNLADGTYVFEIVEDSEVKLIPFIVTEGTVLLDEENTKTVFKPTLQVKDDLLLVNQLSLTQEPLNVTIYYSEEGFDLNAFGVIQSDEIKSGIILQKAYKLDKNKTGRYLVKLTSEGKVFTEMFNF
ncbi:hypothetical protein G5B37_08885 [Rasiella rasia]|uniref:Uncharacterized protein n=1 Tax=Rasiella rasia TaxID=2744027 RepID=A0A6G6GM59_9FLAO|nr:hypothetical protein [Rasiella rasia]QIE59676.1 hypothetical protein G5B37_08885 [Rasiella rasia]